jgi:hypothetical protein
VQTATVTTHGVAMIAIAQVMTSFTWENMTPV